MKHQITFHVDEQLHSRYQKLSKTIKPMGMDVNKTVPYFLVDHLEADEKKNFSGLKKYIGKNSIPEAVND